MGLYQSNVTAFTSFSTFNSDGTTNAPAVSSTALTPTGGDGSGNYYGTPFSAANLGAGFATLATGALTTSPTVSIALQAKVNGVWTNVPSTAGSLTDLAGVTVTASTTTAKVVGSSYVGNMVRIKVNVAGASSSVASLVLTADLQKRFGDNS